MTRPIGRIRTRNVRRDAQRTAQFDRAGVGLAARPDRIRRRRIVGAGDGAVQCLADSVSDLPDTGLADRRRRRRPLGRRGCRSRYRLVLWLRLFRRRPLLDRLRLSGRRADLRLAVTVRGDRPARGARRLYGNRRRPCPRSLDPWGAPHPGFGRDADRSGMAARPYAHRFPMERVRLRTRGAAAVGAKRIVDRAVGPHLHRHRGICEPRHACRRPRRKPAAVAAAVARHRRARWTRRLGQLAAFAPADAARRQSAFAHHAAESAARCEIQLRGQGRGDGPLHRALQSRVRSGCSRHERRDASDLAGIARFRSSSRAKPMRSPKSPSFCRQTPC